MNSHHAGDFDEPYTKPRYPSVAYDIRVAKLTRWTFEVDLDDGTVAAVMTSEEVPESEVNCVPESREERFRRVVHRYYQTTLYFAVFEHLCHKRVVCTSASLWSTFTTDGSISMHTCGNIACRLTMAGHHGERGYRVPKVVDGSSESKLPLVLESRTTPAGGSLLLMPRSTLHALFGGVQIAFMCLGCGFRKSRLVTCLAQVANDEVTSSLACIGRIYV